MNESGSSNSAKGVSIFHLEIFHIFMAFSFIFLFLSSKSVKGVSIFHSEIFHIFMAFSVIFLEG